MDPITEQDLIDAIHEHHITRWVLRKCSLCGDDLTITFLIDGAEFDYDCRCTPYSSPPHLWPLSQVVDLFNQQTPEIRATLWSSLKSS